MEPRIQYAKTEDGVNIAYAIEGEGPPLVMVRNPAVAHVQRAWEMFPAVVAVKRTFRLILYDPRGAGLSDRAPIDFSMEAMMRDLDAIVDHVDLQSFAISSFDQPWPMPRCSRPPDKMSSVVSRRASITGL